VMSDRKQFGIRSIWNLKDYIRDRPLLAELADLNVNTRAQAFDFGDILSTLKQTFLPALKGAAINSLHSLINNAPYIGAAASGSAIRARAASGDIIKPKPFMFAPLERRALAADNEVAWAATSIKYMNRNKRNRAIVAKDDRVVAFPVIVTAEGDDVPVRSQLYAAANTDFVQFRPDIRTLQGRFVIQGQDSAPQAFTINRNIYVFPIDPDQFPKIVPIGGPPVRGASSDGALWLVCHGRFKGVLPYAVTGAVQAPHTLAPNLFFDRKNEFCRRHHVMLGANNPDADVIVEDLTKVVPIDIRERHFAE